MTRPTIVVALVMLLCGVAPARAQAPSPEEGAVLTVVDRFMRAVTSGDAAAMAAVRLADGTNTVERPSPAGGMQVTRRPAPALTIPPGSSQRERYWDPVVHVRGSLAMVWTPYEFWRDGKTSHCGVDVFELVKQDGAWKIGHIMYTVEPDACPALRPKDASRVRPAP